MTAFTDAAVAKIKASRSPQPRIYKPGAAGTTGAVPTNPTKPYTVVSVTGDRTDSFTLDARHGLRHYRVVAQSFGVNETDANAYDGYVFDALNDERLTVDGYDCGPMRVEVGSALVRDPDDNTLIGITSTFTFTAIKEA